MHQPLQSFRNKVILWFFIALAIHTNFLNAQSSGEYRTKKTGLWTDTATWETYNGTAWVSATKYPTYKSRRITIEYDTVTVQSDTLDIDQVFIDYNGRLNIKKNAIVNLKNGKGDDLVCDGYLAINNGTLNFDSSSSLVNDSYGTVSFQAESMLYGDGNFTNAGYIMLSTSLSIPDKVVFKYNSGSINGNGSLTIQGTMNYIGGDINVPLSITNKAVCNINIMTFTTASDITNDGTINWNAGDINFTKKAVFTNNGQFNIHAGGSLNNYNGGHPTLNNSLSGRIKKFNNSNYTRILLDANNEGSIIIDSGGLITSGAFHNYHILTINSFGTYENDGTFYPDSSESLRGAGSFSNEGTTVINFKDTIPKTIEFYNDGWLQGTGQLIIPGTINFGGNCVIPITITKTGTGEGLITEVSATFINNGVLNLYGGNASISGELINNGVINAYEAPRLDARGSVSSFINNGRIKVNGGYGSGLSVGSPFTNSSTGILTGSASFGFGNLLINEGFITPGSKNPGKLSFGINPLRNSSTLNISIGKRNGKTKADNITINNKDITLAGTLNLFQAADEIDTGSYSIVTGGYDVKMKGSFSTVNKPANWTIEYGFNEVVVHVASTGLMNGFTSNNNVAQNHLRTSDNLLIYPNPLNKILNITGLNINADNNLSITGIDGKLLAKVVVKGPDYTWNIGNLASGMYYLVVASGGKTRTVTFMKE